MRVQSFSVPALGVLMFAGCHFGGSLMNIHSTALADGKAIPKKYTKDGEDVSPPLAWDKVPEGAEELALICDDPDAPTSAPWVHWVIYKIPANVHELPEGIPRKPRLDDPPGALQGLNSWAPDDAIGYRGPDPPKGAAHHYNFRLYALDQPLTLKPQADKQSLLKAMAGHIMAEGVLVGTYQR